MTDKIEKHGNEYYWITQFYENFNSRTEINDLSIIYNPHPMNINELPLIYGYCKQEILEGSPPTKFITEEGRLLFSCKTEFNRSGWIPIKIPDFVHEKFRLTFKKGYQVIIVRDVICGGMPDFYQALFKHEDIERDKAIEKGIALSSR